MTTPLKFAKAFARLKSDLAAQPIDDLKLILLTDFWPGLRPLYGDPLYQSYVGEFAALLESLVKESNLHDLTIEELDSMLRIMRELGIAHDVGLSDCERTVTIRLATLYAYVGEIDKVCELCAGLTEESHSYELKGTRPLSAFETLERASDQLSENHPKTSELLKGIADAWEEERGHLWFDRVRCLFVEKSLADSVGTNGRGRMKTLIGSVEESTKLPTDEVAFDNQIKAPDDPFIGAAYHSLRAVSHLLSGSVNKKTDSVCHGHFSIEGSDHTFTGDSIGLGVALVAYAQLLKPDITRYEKFISSEVAFTGAVSPDGALLPVNSRTLNVKLRRAFFSPVKYLVVPQENLRAAESTLDALDAGYPARRLHLIGHDRLQDVMENHNIIRSEKVCMGEFVAKKATRYARATKVQVPALVVLFALLYAVICAQYPKAWVGFDWNPEYVRLTARGFEALNRDSLFLWGVEYMCDTIDSRSKWDVGDLDFDGKNEVVIAVGNPQTAPCEKAGSYLFAYGSDGNELFHRYCPILYEYPGDTSRQLPYTMPEVTIVKNAGQTNIMTLVTASYPSRAHIRLWSSSGDSLGWYINSGFATLDAKYVCSDFSNQLVFLGINNRMGCVCLFELPRGGFSGVSPPYFNTLPELETVKKGNQTNYILFSPSDLNQIDKRLYNGPMTLTVESEGVLTIRVNEGPDIPPCVIDYYVDSLFRVFRVGADDEFIHQREVLVRNKKLEPIEWDRYLENLRDAVTYWTDSGWVTEGELRAVEAREE